MDALIKSMLDQKKWAVVGATANQGKFGYKIYQKLKRFGYEVYAVNPMYSEIEGDKCYPSLADLPVKVDCVDVVVNPEKASEALKDVMELGIKNIWFQPGTFTPEIVEVSEVAGINTVYLNCVLVELDNL